MPPPNPPPPPPSNDYYIAGGLVAGVVLSVLFLCVLCLVRHRRSKEIEKLGAAHSRVKGVTPPETKKIDPTSTSIPPFSRSRLTASIVMPEKSIPPKPSHHGSPDKANVPPASPTLFIHRSLHNASPAPPHTALSIVGSPRPRHHRSSSGFSGYSQYRFPRGSSARVSSASFAPPSPAKLVHQPYEPTLSDELVSRCGEHLTVLHSFDDGWCVVVRDTPRSSRVSIMSWMENRGDNVDIGLVPTWVFSKPLEGVVSKRPFRSTSLNALHLGRDPAYRRDWVTSWSKYT